MGLIKNFFVSLGLVFLLLLGGGVLYYLNYLPWRIHASAFTSPAQIGFVNLNKINTEARAVKHFKELIERQYKNFHEEILDKEKQLQADYGQIQEIEQSSSSPAQDLKDKKDALDRQISDLDKTLRSRKDSLNQSFAEVQDKIGQTIRDIVTDIAKRRGLNIVFNATILDASVVLYGGSDLDITDDVLKELDHKLPTVHLPS